MFEYPYKTNIPEYDSSRVTNKITASCVSILNTFGINYHLAKEDYYIPDLKPNSIFNNLVFTLTDDKMPGTITIEVPDIKNNIVYVRGVKRYLQMQIRDILFVPLDKYVKFLPDLDLEGSITPDSILLQQIGRVPTNIAVINLGDSDKYSDFLKTYNDELYNKFESDRKKKITLTRQHNRVLAYLSTLMKESKVIQVLYKDKFEQMVIKALKMMNEEYDPGMNLNNRRLRKRELSERIEPFASLYDFSIVETQFDSPYSTLSNKVRTTIGGEKSS